jgi:hypothetical protein
MKMRNGNVHGDVENIIDRQVVEVYRDMPRLVQIDEVEEGRRE